MTTRAGLRPVDAADGELRIVGKRGADADHDGVDQRTQAMQMGKPIGAVDVMGMSAGGGDAAVERLAELADHHQVIDRPRRNGPKISSQGGGSKLSDSRSIRGTSPHVSVLSSSGRPWATSAWGFFRIVTIVS